MRIVCGIDPGKKGGIAIIGNDVSAMAMPAVGNEIDIHRISNFLHNNHVELVIVEKVHAMPGQGVTSMFTFGKNFGEIIGMLKTDCIPYQLVTPQAWKKTVLAGMPWKKNKKCSIDFCMRKYPELSLLATKRSRVPHDGMADAICIAEYGRRIENGK